ncbi:hypothetical protein SAICODRAFT_87754 [Saitoella complicata NRRL Y-17804]|uniref:uncharacterized protein n=1 Tax=Saitoella complicata (strain BCRC 22490 / CBS 7301 / JCM 7358 / NBRC 10748 / NRRL Y-17804) TaxID=698492 RepID=UPI0008681C32|nr:uncharacterized protein SAICODRAFT_87754 [Saitoella complicata NRRL Y-17804]ODQ55657.1 hypothetical protein SAICODRAFT_87754 [Saitoella complicata NRRL Y-17804]
MTYDGSLPFGQFPGGKVIPTHWSAAQIVYTIFMGTLLLAAILEWFLFLAAFMYCFVKVYQKAETRGIKIMASINIIVFCALRGVFLPITLVTVPLVPQIQQYIPERFVWFCQWFAFWAFSGLLTIPWLFCVYRLVTTNVGKHRRIKEVLDENTAPKVVVVMPIYNEIPHILMHAIDSAVEGDYPASCVHIFCSFDGDEENELYLKTLESLGVPLSLDTYPISLDVTYRGARITVSRFPHGGKRHCQKKSFKLIDRIYVDYLKTNDNLFILFIDSDIILDKVCIQNFMYDMELKPGSTKDMLAMTGVITCTADKQSLITVLQDVEYIHGQLFERSVESACGAVTCLPGALTMLRFSAFRKMAKYYFADQAEHCDDLFDFGKCHLGEDRWLTHLFMIGAKRRYQLQMCSGAFCKTEAVLTFESLLKQRRRWFIGYITNEACMLTDIRLWRRYPILCLVRLMQNTIRTTALLFFILVLSVITTNQTIGQIPVGFIAFSLGLNWALMIYFGLKLRRFKAWLYPLQFVISPAFNWIYMVYGIFTAGQRTWGGPRADAAKADPQTTPAEAIAQAEATGDELNVVPETFRRNTIAPLPTQPDDRVDGMFTEGLEEGREGVYAESEWNNSMDSLPHNNQIHAAPGARRMTLHPNPSFDSIASGDESSVNLPRRVESIMDGNESDSYSFEFKHGRTESSGSEGSFRTDEQLVQPEPALTSGQDRSYARGKSAPVRKSRLGGNVVSGGDEFVSDGEEGGENITLVDLDTPERRGRSPGGRPE